MIKTSTDSDIVKYIYNQFNNKEKIDFESKLLFDSNLNILIEDYYFIIDEIEEDVANCIINITNLFMY